VLHNFARDMQHVMDDLLLHEVDIELDVSPNEPIDADNLIRSIQVTSEWDNFREQLYFISCWTSCWYLCETWTLFMLC
jgi:hypothetical protein